MSLRELTANAVRVIGDNSPAILTAIGVTGTMSTAYLAGRGAFQASKVLHRHEMQGAELDELPTKKRIVEQAKITWKLYIPAFASGTLTIVVIVAGHKVGSKRAAAAYSLLGVTERAFEEYTTKVIEQVGVKGEQKIRDEIMQDRVTTNPPSMVVLNAGKALCMEAHTGRYFECDMETLRKAENTVNSMILRHDTANLNDLYYLIGLDTTPYSGSCGWTSDKILEMRYTAVLHDGKPCLVFDYNYVRAL